jgi:hypothetical protein
MLKSSSLCLYSSNLGTFLLTIEQFWPFEEMSIFSNGGHLGYRTALTDKILKGTHPGNIPARFGLIWFSGFRGEDLNVIFLCKLEKRGHEIKKKSSLKLLSQFQPNFAEMILGWSSSKIVSGISELRPR